MFFDPSCQLFARVAGHIEEANSGTFLIILPDQFRGGVDDLRLIGQRKIQGNAAGGWKLV
jgi:hypothetical protein